MAEEEQSPFASGFTFHDQYSEESEFSGDIPREDWELAWALISKYPPQIVLWIMRALLSSRPPPVWTTFATSSLMTSVFSTTPSNESMHTQSLEADFSSPVTSHLRLSLFSTSSLNDSSLPCESADINGILHNDVVDTCVAARKFDRERNTITATNGALIGQSAEKIPNAQCIVTSMLTVPDKKEPNQLEKRWFCVYDEHQDKSFGKTADWKKHMNNFHRPGKKAWQCRKNDCRQIFDTASNFSQHHRKMHNCRKPCRHSDNAKMRIPIRRAFACGYQSCDGLLPSWDEWRNHVAQHMENGMTISQWQYNTLLRNLLRRPEIHPCWERHVKQQVFPYNVPPRFNWRPRNTISLKWQLEHLDGVELSKRAADLALQVYESGLEVRSAQELMDSPGLIAEPILMRKQPQYSPPTLFDDSDGQTGFSSFPTFHQESQGLRTHSRDPPSLLTSAIKSPDSNLDNEQLSEFRLFGSSL